MADLTVHDALSWRRKTKKQDVSVVVMKRWPPIQVGYHYGIRHNVAVKQPGKRYFISVDLMCSHARRFAQLIFVTASSVEQNGKAREVIVESRPLYAVVQLNGPKEKYPVAWEMIYKLAKRPAR